MSVTMYQVGGSVRDELLGLKSKDIDFAVECSGFEEMREHLQEWGFEIFLEQPEFMTIRARFPRGVGFEFAGQQMDNVTADFVVCRTEAHYSDARHPDSVGVGTIFDDLSRRDFTVNAIAKRTDGTLLDPFNGQVDLENGVLSAVGDPYDRLAEDPLRILRAIRFSITKKLRISDDLASALGRQDLIEALVESVSIERVREELYRMFKADTTASTFLLFDEYGFSDVGYALFRSGRLWLKPTLEDR